VTGTSSRNAPPGTICCTYCRRYLNPEKMEGTRCRERDVCRRVAAQWRGRAPKLSKRDRKALGML
jgi:hypothetical protein